MNICCYNDCLHGTTSLLRLWPTFTSFAKNVFLYGWDDLARQVDILAHSTTAKPLLVVGMDKYRIASGLAFYRNKTNRLEQKRSDINETTGNKLFGNNALMFNYWCPPEQALSRDILVIAEDRNRLDPANFTNHYRKLGKIQEINSKREGKVPATFFIVQLHHIRPTLMQALPV